MSYIKNKVKNVCFEPIESNALWSQKFIATFKGEKKRKN